MKIKFKDLCEQDQQEILSLISFKNQLKKQLTTNRQCDTIEEREREK